MENVDLMHEQQQIAIDEIEKNQVIMSPGQLVIRRFLRNKLAIVGICVLIFMILFSFIGPLFVSYGQATMFYIIDTGEEIPGTLLSQYKNDSPVLNLKAKPSSKHWLGTDEMGRDVFTRLMYGGRVSLLIGLCVVVFELALGITLGGIAGYYGGIVDMIVMRLVEIFYSIPFIPLMLIISAVMIQFKISPSVKIYYIMVIMGILFWAGVARMIRGQILSLRETEYMQAAEATGIRPSKKILKHLIPNVMPIIIVIGTMDLGGIILTESVMSYLGVGVPATEAAWGNMVGAVSDYYILRDCWYIWMPPGLCILLTVLAFNFVGDGLRDAFDPKMKR